MKYCIVDAGYKTPAIAKMLIDDGVTPVFPYKRPMTKDGFFRKHSMCMMNTMMHTFVRVIISCTTAPPIEMGIGSTKSCGKICEGCQYLSQCTASKDHVKLVTRHVWEDYMETCEDIRQTIGMKDLYSHRKKRQLKESLEQQRKPWIPDIHKCTEKRG